MPPLRHQNPMPSFGPRMDLMDQIMTPDMIRGAANMMSNMDPAFLKSMMSMTGLPADALSFDPEEAKRAADKLRNMTTDEILALKNTAVKALPGGLVSFASMPGSKPDPYMWTCVYVCTHSAFMEMQDSTLTAFIEIQHRINSFGIFLSDLPQ